MVGCETSIRKRGKTHDIRLEFPTIYTDTLQYLLHFHDEAFYSVSAGTCEWRGKLTRMEHRPRQLDMTEVTWTLRHTLSASLALEIPVYST